MSTERFPDMSWEDMEVVNHENGQLMFPSKVRYRTKDGTVKAEPVMVRIPSPVDHLKARPEARGWLAQLKIDPEKDPKLLEQAEDLVLLAKAIRTFEAPHSQYETAEVLSEKYDEGCLRDIKERIQYFKDMLDPREPVRTDEEFWATVAEVKRKKNLLPLADIAGHEVPSFIMRLVWEASSSPTAPSSLRSSENSTPEP